MTILDECEGLIAAEKTKEALEILASRSGVAVILKARYNDAVKQHNIGFIDRGDFARVVTQTNYALPELAATIPDPPPVQPEALRQLLGDILPYIHDLRVGFLEPQTQAAGYDQKTVNSIYTRLVEALK